MEGAPVPEWSPDDAGYLFDAQLSSVEMIPCNYFQAMENIMDDVHVAFAHQDTYINTTARRGIPKVTAEETSFGLTQVLDRGAWTDKIHLVMPNISYLTHPWVIPEELRERVKTNLVRSLVWYVPIDDESFYHFRVGLASVLSIREYASLHPRTRHLWPVVADEINAVVSGRKTMKDVAGHPQLVRIQDGVCLAGQGRIVDRSNERLGRSDVALIRLRKIWTRELRALAAGEPLTPFGRPEPDPVMRIERAATGVEAVSV
jgi:5,5'-dehydrodivanillate O-demethylase